MKIFNAGITFPEGFSSSGLHCGLKKRKLDLALVKSDVICNASGVFTKNFVVGAPIVVCKEKLSNHKAQAILINSAVANTGNGIDGINDANLMCEYVNKYLELNIDDVLVSSTGVIGKRVDTSKVQNAAEKLVTSLSKENSNDSAKAIMTTDTFSKEYAVSEIFDGCEVKFGAMAKGSGMIEPNMGTMLGFITTDLNIKPELLDKALKLVTQVSFNRVSVDGDTSTNDMVIVLANGLANNKIIDSENEDFDKFVNVLKNICIKLAKEIARDGEGATKMITCNVKNTLNFDDANILSKAVINSSLVKTAMFGEDANWGRILSSLGGTSVVIDPSLISISYTSEYGSISVFENGHGIDFDEDKASTVLKSKEVTIDIDMNIGDECSYAWGCDLSYDYVKINGDYRS